MDSQSLAIAKLQLQKTVKIKIDRPLGSKHPKWGFEYDANYGYLEGVMAPDGEELDAYLLKVNEPVSEYTGKVIAIIHRIDNDDDKLVVIPENETISDEEIETQTKFQEKYFKHIIIR